jgi:glucose/arabinose dehydrogenase
MRSILLLLTGLFLIGCLSDETDDMLPPNLNDEAVFEAFPKLTFNRPVDFQHAGDQSDRVFIVEQPGVIHVFQNDESVSETTEFLDIRGQVDDSGNEMGLLGLAFHPDYESNGYLYVNYTASSPDRIIISRFSVSDDNPDQADPDSEVEILTYDQPYSNHNGGQIGFGPDDYLYIASGDGGSGGDPHGHGQNRSTLLGAILRIDVDVQENGNNYGIPGDNPFLNNEEGYREEIFAWGLRNPWRFSFDEATGNLWAADVGQNRIESIYIVENGLNYGWNIVEGSSCFEPSTGCETDGLEMPIYEYNQDQGDRSITGGYVYNGSDLPELTGLYIYADYISGRIWALEHSDLDNPVNTELIRADFSISSFGTDQHNELYICGFDGKIYRFGEGILDQLP